MTPDDFARRLDSVRTYDEISAWADALWISGLLDKNYECYTSAGRRLWLGSWPSTATITWDHGNNSKGRLVSGDVVGYRNCTRTWERKQST